MSREAMKLALEYLEESDNYLGSLDHSKPIAALREALAKSDFWEGYVPEPDKRQQALDRMAENARELGLDYEPAQQEPVAWTPIDKPYPPGGELDILMGDGSILCEVLPQADGDLWWGGASTGERFIDPKYASVTHWRIHAEHTSPPAQRTWVGLEKSDMPDGADPLFDDPKFMAGMVYAANKLMEKNT